jgi:hypothetical protein
MSAVLMPVVKYKCKITKKNSKSRPTFRKLSRMIFPRCRLFLKSEIPFSLKTSRIWAINLLMAFCMFLRQAVADLHERRGLGLEAIFWVAKYFYKFRPAKQNPT